MTAHQQAVLYTLQGHTFGQIELLAHWDKDVLYTDAGHFYNANICLSDRVIWPLSA